MNKRKRELNDLTSSSSINNNNNNNNNNEENLIRNILKPIGRIPSSSFSSSSSFSNNSKEDSYQFIGQLFSSSDLILLNKVNSSIFIFKEVIYCLKPSLTYFQTNYFNLNYESIYFNYYKDKNNNSHFILYSNNGKIIFALTGEDNRISKIEYQANFEDNEEIITTMCILDSFAIFGTSNNNIYLIGRDYSSVQSTSYNSSTRIYCYKLSKPRNIFSDWIDTGSKLLGLQWNTEPKTPLISSSHQIIKLLPLTISSLQSISSISSSSFPSSTTNGRILLNSNFLFSLNLTSLSLWQLNQYESNISNFSHHFNLNEENQEKLFWEINLQLLLESDLNHQLNSVITNHFTHSSKNSTNNIKLHRKFIFLDLFILNSNQINSNYNGLESNLDNNNNNNNNNTVVYFGLLSIVYPNSQSKLSNSYLLLPELWFHIIRVEIFNPNELNSNSHNSHSNNRHQEINLTSSLLTQQSVCQIKLRRRVAILNSFKTSQLSPKLLPGNKSNSIIVTWYDDLTLNSQITNSLSLHTVELIDLHHFINNEDKLNNESNEFNFLNSNMNNNNNNNNNNNHHNSNKDSFNPINYSDSTAYTDYFLLHDTQNLPTHSNRSNSFETKTNGSINENSTTIQKSNLCEGVGSDTGVLSSCIISVESIKLENDELGGNRKGLTIITSDHTILTCIPPEVSVISLYTTTPLPVAPPTNILKILFQRCLGETSLDECYSSLLLAASFLYDSAPNEGIFTINSIQKILEISIQASNQLLESDGDFDDTKLLSSLPSASGLITTKIKRHERLIEITSQIIQFSPQWQQDNTLFSNFTSQLTSNHHLLLASLSLVNQVQEIRKRVEFKNSPRNKDSNNNSNNINSNNQSNLQRQNRGGRILSSFNSSISNQDNLINRSNRDNNFSTEQSRDQLMVSGEEELLKIIQNGFQKEIISRKKENLFHKDYIAEGWSVMDIFFVQPLLFSRGILTILSILYENYRHISNARGGIDINQSQEINQGKINHQNLNQNQTNSTYSKDESFSINQLLATSYCFCSLLLSIIQSPLQAEEEKKLTSTSSSNSNSSNIGRFQNRLDLEKKWKEVNNSLSIVCREEIRKAISISLECFQFSYDIVSSQSNSLKLDLIRPDWEGNRLHQLSYALLLGYEVNPSPLTSTLKIAMSSPESLLHQIHPSHLSEEYHHAKLRCINVLLSIHSYEEAYTLSIRFHCFVGVMKAVWTPSELKSLSSTNQSNLLLPQLHRQLSENSSFLSIIHPFPTVISFGIFCFEWLEKHHKYQEILDLGKYTPDQLHQFLQTRPYLSWIQSLYENQYSLVSKDINLYCRGEMIDPKTNLIKQLNPQKLHETKPQSLKTTKSLLNISKLSSWIQIVESNQKIESEKKFQNEEEKQQQQEQREQEQEELLEKDYGDEETKSSSESVILQKKFDEANESWKNVNQSLICTRSQQFIEENKSLLKFIDGSSLQENNLNLWNIDSFQYIPLLLQIATNYLPTNTILDQNYLTKNDKIQKRSIAKTCLSLIMKLFQIQYNLPNSKKNKPNLNQYIVEFWRITVGIDEKIWSRLCTLNSQNIYNEQNMLESFQNTILFYILSAEVFNTLKYFNETNLKYVELKTKYEHFIKDVVEVLKSNPHVVDSLYFLKNEDESESEIQSKSELEDKKITKQLLYNQLLNIIKRCIQLAQNESLNSSIER